MTTIQSSPTRRHFQKKIDELFSYMPYKFGIGDVILIAGAGFLSGKETTRKC